MLDPGKPSFTPKKAKTSVVMFVGLQGIFFSLYSESRVDYFILIHNISDFSFLFSIFGLHNI